MVAVVAKKAAELDPEVGRKFILESEFTRMTRNAAVESYLKGFLKQASGEIDWRGLTEDLTELNTKGKTAPVFGNAGAETTLALAWAGEDLAASMEWFVEDFGRDTRNLDSAKVIGSVLAKLPVESQAEVVDWVEQQGIDEGGNRLAEGFVSSIAKTATFLGPEVERAVGLIPDESRRFESVASFLNPEISKPIGRVEEGDSGFRFTRAELSFLVNSAELTAENQASLLKRIEAGIVNAK